MLISEKRFWCFVAPFGILALALLFGGCALCWLKIADAQTASQVSVSGLGLLAALYLLVLLASCIPQRYWKE